jgi:uncharacterized membrane protein
METTAAPLITNDAIVLGILMLILGFVFWTSARQQGYWKKFYTFVPSLLLCYFIPSLLSTTGIIADETSNLYFVASRYLLPTSLVLLTLSMDLPGVMRLGPRAVIMFFTATVGIVLGGPLAVIIFAWFSPDLVAGEVWRGLATVAGSWIGGGANQAAMFEVFEVDAEIFAAFVAVDVIVANVWMAFLLYGAGRSETIDRRNGANTSTIDDLKKKVTEYQASIAKMPRLPDTMVVLAVGFAVTGLSHLGADFLAPWIEASAPALGKVSLTSHFFWLVVLATTGGLVLSFTRARQLEGVGASRIGSVFIYVLVATIGMKMNLRAIFEHPGLFMVGALWIAIHAGLLLLVGRLIRAPFFFVAVGSQANIGGAASAPIVASAFSPSLAPVGVLLAVLGYALGTFGAWACGHLMRIAAP